MSINRVKPNQTATASTRWRQESAARRGVQPTEKQRERHAGNNAAEDDAALL